MEVLMEKEYQICTKCIMDTTDPDIQFDKNGICNHCRKYEERAKKELFLDETGKQKLKKLVTGIKEKGENKKYDCIIGLSGGIDSTMVAYTVKKLGFRPLAIHVDNGWNSEKSVSNIEKTCKSLDLKLYKYVIDWEEFKDLQLSFLKASVANAEIPTDNAILATLYHTAAEKRIQFIMSGGNIVTEGIMPESWGYDLRDLRHIKSLHKRFGRVKLKSFHKVGLFLFLYYTFVKKIKFIPILNYIPYDKKNAMQLLKKELGWIPYGLKHYESIYTRFFQGYILPRKFNVDKRKAHLSTLICSGQMTREEALEEMKHDIYPVDKLKEDKEYVIKKLGLSEKEFEQIMSLPIKTYREYPSNYWAFTKMDFLKNFVKKVATYRQ